MARVLLQRRGGKTRDAGLPTVNINGHVPQYFPSLSENVSAPKVSPSSLDQSGLERVNLDWYGETIVSRQIST